uniref:Uncharacterized protein n=1 Tax=Micrurus lemniscatus lemniscatus TaxID=129467 RepID=A0A2D4IPL7_MICLE
MEDKEESNICKFSSLNCKQCHSKIHSTLKLLTWKHTLSGINLNFSLPLMEWTKEAKIHRGYHRKETLCSVNPDIIYRYIKINAMKLFPIKYQIIAFIISEVIFKKGNI